MDRLPRFRRPGFPSISAVEAAIVQTHGRAGFYFGDTQRTAAEGHRRLWDIAGLSVRAPNERRDDASQWVMMKVQPMMLQSAVFDRDAYRAAGALERGSCGGRDSHLFLRLRARAVGIGPCAARGAHMTTTTRAASSCRRAPTTPQPGVGVLGGVYDDVLRDKPSLGAAHRRELRRRLGDARSRLARRALAERHPVGAPRGTSALSFTAGPAEGVEQAPSAGGRPSAHSSRCRPRDVDSARARPLSLSRLDRPRVGGPAQGAGVP